MTASLKNTDEVALAEAQVAEQRAQLAKSLQAASKSGEKFARRIGRELKPAVTAAVVVAGAAAVVGISVAIARRSSRNRGWRAPAQPSFLGNAAKAAGLWALRALGRRITLELVSRLSDSSEARPALEPARTANGLGAQ
jgi:hypothetical protein